MRLGFFFFQQNIRTMQKSVSWVSFIENIQEGLAKATAPSESILCENLSKFHMSN